MYGRDLTAAQVAAAPSPMQQAAQTALTNFGGTVGGALSQYGMYQGLMAQNPANLYSTPPSGSPYAGAGATTGSDMSITGIIPEVG
jgi:hypothetical protein